MLANWHAYVLKYAALQSNQLAGMLVRHVKKPPSFKNMAVFTPSIVTMVPVMAAPSWVERYWVALKSDVFKPTVVPPKVSLNQ